MVKAETSFDDEDSATAIATEHLDATFAAKQAGGSVVDVALFLRHEGYKKLEEFRALTRKPRRFALGFWHFTGTSYGR